MTTTGIILAGGKSSRMGSPKHSLRVADGSKTMLESVIHAMQPAVDTLVISSQSEVLPGYRWIPDQRPDHAGPLAALEAVLSAFSNEEEAEHFLVCPCDMPLIQSNFLQAMLDVDTSQPIVALRFDDERSPRPLPMRVHRECLKSIVTILDLEANSHQPSMKSLRALMESCGVHELHAPRDWQEALININTPADWENLKRRMQ